MLNLAMQRKLDDGECLDVRKVGTPVPGHPDVFELREFVDDVDYADAKDERWIWSIGQAPDGRIFAATDSRYYQNPLYVCLWLR